MIVYLDTNIVIYMVEGHPAFAPKAVLRLAAAQSAGGLMARAIWRSRTGSDWESS